MGVRTGLTVFFSVICYCNAMQVFEMFWVQNTTSKYSLILRSIAIRDQLILTKPPICDLPVADGEYASWGQYNLLGGGGGWGHKEQANNHSPKVHFDYAIEPAFCIGKI